MTPRTLGLVCFAPLVVGLLSGCGPDLRRTGPTPKIDLGAPVELDGGSDFSVGDLATNPCSCDRPPSPMCSSGTMLTVSTGPGSCGADGDGGAGGGCVYPTAVTTCLTGCFSGACVGALSFLGHTAAYLSGVTSNNVVTNGMNIDTGQSVTIVTETYPPGAASDVHLVYSNNGRNLDNTNPGTDLVLTYDKFTQNNDQWYAVIPAQLSATTVYWYVYARGNGVTAPLYDSNSSANYNYGVVGAGPDFAVADLALSDFAGSCNCETPPAASCTTPMLTSSGAGECEHDGGTHCSYPSSTKSCTHGCFSASCGDALSFLGNAGAFAGVNTVTNGGSVAANQSVTIVAQTYPPGSVSNISVVYSNSGNLTASNPGVSITMTYDKYISNNDQWYAIIPGQASGTTVYWYVVATGFGVATPYYYSNEGGNFNYQSQ